MCASEGGAGVAVSLCARVYVTTWVCEGLSVLHEPVCACEGVSGSLYMNTSVCGCVRESRSCVCKCARDSRGICECAVCLCM